MALLGNILEAFKNYKEIRVKSCLSYIDIKIYLHQEKVLGNKI
jgi:hypothetical protein